MINPNLQDETRYLDVAKYIEKNESNSYMDFEGMCETEGLLERAEWAAKLVSDPLQTEVFATVKTLIVHYLHMARDSADYEPTDEVLAEVATAIHMVISCRWFLKEDAK